jgi:hypothetical protein
MTSWARGGAGLILGLLAACGDEDGGPDDATDPSPGDTLRLSAVEAAGAGEETLVRARGLWNVWDKGGDLPPLWRTDPRAIGTWKGMTSPLGYGESYVNPISFGSSASNKHITSYFQTTFPVVDPGIVVRLRLELMYDDGVVVYLNGHEMGRAHMPPGTITSSTLALGHEANNAYLSFDVSGQIPHLRTGDNHLAVEVHQQTASSSDLVFDAALYAVYDAASGIPAVSGGIPRESHWSYWDAGGDLGTSWRSRLFDDHDWRTGRGVFGYGEDYVRTQVSFGPNPGAKHVTTYFRKKFVVENPTTIAFMRASLKYDDGLVIYLNGAEVERRSMPAGDITAATPALDHEAHDVFELSSWSAQHLLVAGTNVLAVEVHQASPASSDLVFDLRLDLFSTRVLTRLLLPRRSEWSYHDDGPVDPGWKARFFGTFSKFGLAPLGYGESGLQTQVSFGPSASTKPITTYFTRNIDWALPGDPSGNVQSVRARALYDDGFVVYLNDIEIGRASMPSGPVDASTRAFAREAGSLYEEYTWDHIIPLLQGDGDNWIKVEVHQASPSSSDLVFDLEIEITYREDF